MFLTGHAFVGTALYLISNKLPKSIKDRSKKVIYHRKIDAISSAMGASYEIKVLIDFFCLDICRIFSNPIFCSIYAFIYISILNKSENATLLLLVKMTENLLQFQVIFYKIKCITSSYHLLCTWFPSVLEQAISEA